MTPNQCVVQIPGSLGKGEVVGSIPPRSTILIYMTQNVVVKPVSSRPLLLTCKTEESFRPPASIEKPSAKTMPKRHPGRGIFTF